MGRGKNFVPYLPRRLEIMKKTSHNCFPLLRVQHLDWDKLLYGLMMSHEPRAHFEHLKIIKMMVILPSQMDFHLFTRKLVTL